MWMHLRKEFLEKKEVKVLTAIKSDFKAKNRFYALPDPKKKFHKVKHVQKCKNYSSLNTH